MSKSIQSWQSVYFAFRVSKRSYGHRVLNSPIPASSEMDVCIMHVQAECPNKRNEMHMFEQNLNSILIFHGSFPNGVSFSPLPSPSPFLSRALSVSFYSGAISLSVSLSLSSPSIVHARCLSPLSSLSLSFPRLSFPLEIWLSFWVGTCHLFFASLSRVAESFSMEPWIMFMGRNDKECYLRPTVTIARGCITRTII